MAKNPSAFDVSQRDINSYYEDKGSPFSIYIIPLSENGRDVVGDQMVVARVSEDIGIDLGATYGDLVSVDNSGQLGKVFNSISQRSFVTQALSKQVWTGAATQEISFELFFVAVRNPKEEVRDQIVRLYRLVTPTEEVSNAPRSTLEAAGQKIWGKLLKSPPLVSIVIPNVLSIPKGYITRVEFKQSMRLMKNPRFGGDALPMRATGSITVKPEYMILREQLNDIFPTSQGLTSEQVLSQTGGAVGRFT